jgi:hypothetical protein
MAATGAPETETRKTSETMNTFSIKEKQFGSHKIHLRRKDFNSHYPKEVRAEAILRLSAVFKGRQPLRGFDNPEEEKKYLSGVVDVSPNHPDWDKYTRTYWLEKRIKVPFAGVELEIGTHENGAPIDIESFINYHFAKRHPLVATTENEMNASQQKMFFLYDAKKDMLKKNADVQMSKKADREFIKASDDPKHMRNLLQVLSSNVRVHLLNDANVETALYDLKEKDPKKFLEYALDETLDLKAEISQFIQEGILIKVGASVVHGNDTLADTEEECVKYLRNPKQSGLLNILRTKYKEAIR